MQIDILRNRMQQEKTHANFYSDFLHCAFREELHPVNMCSVLIQRA